MPLEEAPVETGPSPDRGRRARWSRGELLLAGGAALTGLVIRIWILATPRLGYLDADEAVVGLMARQFPGERPIFFWGQHYGGVAEPLLTAVVFRITGASVLGLKLVPVVLAAVAALLVAAIGRRLGGTRLAVVAGSVFWVWPAPFVWWSTKSRGFYWIVVVAGLVAVLLLLQLASSTAPRPGGRAWWARVLGLGFAVGVGWWSSPQVALMVVPVAAWFALTAWPRAWRVGLAAVPAFFVGSFPWWLENLRHGFASLDSPVADADPYPVRLGSILVDGTPMLLGVKVPYAESWMPLGRLVFVVVAVAVVAGAVRLGRAERRGPGLAVVATLVAYPMLAAVSPLAGYVGEGRYLVFVAPFVALALGAAATRIPIGVAAAALAGLALTTVIVLAELTAVPGPSAPDVAIPDDIGPLVELLDELGVRTAEADYWVAYRVTFESDEAITVATTSGVIRNDSYQDAVRSGADARIFVAGSGELDRFEAELAARGTTYARYEVDGFVVFHLRSERPGRAE